MTATPKEQLRRARIAAAKREWWASPEGQAARERRRAVWKRYRAERAVEQKG